MDLSSFVPKDTLQFALKDPRTGKDTDAVFTLASPTHAAYVAAERAMMDVMLAAAEDGKEKPDKATRDAASNAFIAGCVLGWSGLTEGGVEVPYSADKVLSILTDRKYREIRDQLDRALGDKKRFFE